MAALPYMPLYVADYLADAAHLSTLGHGAYLLLIMTYWQRGGPLPSDDRKLARIARLTDAEWADLRPDMVEFFAEVDGRWRHKRIDRELVSVNAKIEQTRNAGRASAERRLNGRSTPVATPAERTFNDTDTDTDKKVPLDKSNGAPLPKADPIKAIFDEGRDLLIASGVGAKQAGSLVGKWRRDHGDGALMEVFTAARSRGLTNPVEWITRGLAARGNERRVSSGRASIEATAPCL